MLFFVLYFCCDIEYCSELSFFQTPLSVLIVVCNALSCECRRNFSSSTMCLWRSFAQKNYINLSFLVMHDEEKVVFDKI